MTSDASVLAGTRNATLADLAVVLRADRPDLYDTNVNGWLASDGRRFLIRCLRGGDGGGVARAFLSDGYKIIDNLDVLLAALDGVRASGLPAEVDGCDLTDRRMYIRVVCEQVAALAPALLAGYGVRSPARPGRITRWCSPGS